MCAISCESGRSTSRFERTTPYLTGAGSVSSTRGRTRAVRFAAPANSSGSSNLEPKGTGLSTWETAIRIFVPRSRRISCSRRRSSLGSVTKNRFPTCRSSASPTYSETWWPRREELPGSVRPREHGLHHLAPSPTAPQHVDRNLGSQPILWRDGGKRRESCGAPRSKDEPRVVRRGRFPDRLSGGAPSRRGRSHRLAGGSRVFHADGMDLLGRQRGPDGDCRPRTDEASRVPADLAP